MPATRPRHEVYSTWHAGLLIIARSSGRFLAAARFRGVAPSAAGRGPSCHAVDVRVDVLAGAGRRHRVLRIGQLRVVERGREVGHGHRGGRRWGVADDVGGQLRFQRAQHHDPGGDVHRAGGGRARVDAVQPRLRRRYVGQRRPRCSRGSSVDRGRRGQRDRRQRGAGQELDLRSRRLQRRHPGLVERARRSGPTTSSRASCRAAAQSTPTRSSPTPRTTSTSTTTTSTTTSRASCRPDGVSTGYRITNNVIHTSTGYPCMHLGDTRSGSDHATTSVATAQIRVYGGNQNVASQNMTVRDNARRHRRLGVLGLHHRPQPDGDLHGRLRALRLRDRRPRRAPARTAPTSA